MKEVEFYSFNLIALRAVENPPVKLDGGVELESRGRFWVRFGRRETEVYTGLLFIRSFNYDSYWLFNELFRIHWNMDLDPRVCRSLSHPDQWFNAWVVMVSYILRISDLGLIRIFIVVSGVLSGSIAGWDNFIYRMAWWIEIMFCFFLILFHVYIMKSMKYFTTL